MDYESLERIDSLLEQYGRCLDEKIKGLKIAVFGTGLTLLASTLTFILPVYTSLTSDKVTLGDRRVQVNLIKNNFNQELHYQFQGDIYVDRNCDGSLDELVIHTSTNGKRRREFMRVKNGEKGFEDFIPYFESVRLLASQKQHI